MTRRSSAPPRAFFLALALFAAGLVVLAQTPAPTAQPPAGQAGQLPAPGTPPVPGPPGREGGRGRGQDLTGIDFTKQPSIQAKTPEDELKQFILPPGYRLELVMSDPLIQEPTAIAFDGNGRMFVVEDRSYMLDIDMTGQLDPISRISLHIDTNNDGIYDKHTVFVDHVVFPRFVVPFGPNTILTKESNAQEVWKYSDTDGDGVADKKELFDTGYGRLANIEGQEAFLTWGLDNWMYSTYNAFRARWTPHGVVKEPTGNNRGEWGVTQDNDGKMWFESGAPGLPVSFQFPIVYGNFNVPDELEPDFRIPWGAPVRVADMQGGLNATRMPDGSLKGVTGSAGNDIYRGHRLPKDLVGDYLYGEPVGRIVRRIHSEKREGLTYLHNVYPNSEFIKSLDPLFRPVDVTTAPDGTVYITDMYHGIIQVGNFAGPGTYLRARIQQYDLDKIIHKGRIWRLVYDGVKRDRSDALRRDRVAPRMNNESPAQLITHFTHPNGWWRDTAQQLLVLKQDRSVVPQLVTMTTSSPNLLARFHALWTLEGLGALKSALVRRLMEDPEPRMRVQAIRASETLYKGGDRSFSADYATLTRDADVDVVIQAMLTINRWKVDDAAATTKTVMESNQAKGVQLVGTTMLTAAANANNDRGRGNLSEEQRNQLDRGGQIYNELCFACHGPDALGTPTAEPGVTQAPPLAGSSRVNAHRDYIIKVVLNGLVGPLDGKTFPNAMIAMNNNDDEWVAAVTSYVRNRFGNSGGFVTPADVTRVRAASAARKTSWTLPELTATIPHPLDTEGWKVTSSQNADAAVGALRLTGWNTGQPQQTGQWFQVELPKAEIVMEIQFQSPAPGGRGGAGNAVAVSAGGAPVVAPGGFPRGYTVEVSQDGASWTAAAQGTGNGPTTISTFTPISSKFVRITLTANADDAPAWSVQNLRIFSVPPPDARTQALGKN
jgi:mono/diheme cytochrome c family protein/glucose/arabinose dehydrogenase